MFLTYYGMAVRRKSFVEVLLEIPEVGQDEDFERREDDGRTDVFD